MRGVSTRRTTPVSEVTHVPTSEQSAGVMCVMFVCLCACVFSVPSPVEHQICPAVCVLMKLSFDEEHRHAMNELGGFLWVCLPVSRSVSFPEPSFLLLASCFLLLTLGCSVPAGGLQAVAELLQVDCEMFGLSSDHYSITLRRYAGMALTNLTFGDVANKVRGT